MIEVLKQALEALETEVSIDWTNNDEFNASAEKMHDAITSLRQAIAELEREKEIHDRHCNQGEWKGVCKYSDSNCPTIAELESQEPVGWIDSKGNMVCVKINESCKPLYTTPQQRKPLTDEQIAEEFYKFEAASAWYQFARAIEAAHGIKE